MSKNVKYEAGVILKEVRRLKKEYPDAVYTVGSNGTDVCSYIYGKVTNGPKTHGCIVGQAIRKCYPDLFNTLKKYEKDTSEGIFLLGVSNIGLTGSTTTLERIQQNQDSGKKWGEC